MTKEFLNAKQVAESFFNNECSYYKVLRLTRNGIIPAKKIGKSYLYKLGELEKWATKNFSRSTFSNFKI